MKPIKSLFLFLTVVFLAGICLGQPPIKFSNEPRTNTVNLSDLWLLDSDVGGGVFSTRTIVHSNLVTALGINLTGTTIRIFTNGTVLGPRGPINTAGTTTAGIQEAINALTNWSVGLGGAGGGIEFEPGVYTCSGQIIFPTPNPIAISLSGRGGDSKTILKYTGNTNFIQDTVNGGTDILPNLNLVVQDIGFAYVNDTNNAYIWDMTQVNLATFDRCYWVTWNALNSATNAGYNASIVPVNVTNKVGIVGYRDQSTLTLKTVFRNCKFAGLAGGVGCRSDHMLIQDAFFSCIGHWSNSAAPGTTWVTNNNISTNGMWTNLWAYGVAVASMPRQFELSVIRPYFYECAAGTAYFNGGRQSTFRIYDADVENTTYRTLFGLDLTGNDQGQVTYVNNGYVSGAAGDRDIFYNMTNGSIVSKATQLATDGGVSFNSAVLTMTIGDVAAGLNFNPFTVYNWGNPILQVQQIQGVPYVFGTGFSGNNFFGGIFNGDGSQLFNIKGTAVNLAQGTNILFTSDASGKLTINVANNGLIGNAIPCVSNYLDAQFRVVFTNKCTGAWAYFDTNMISWKTASEVASNFIVTNISLSPLELGGNHFGPGIANIYALGLTAPDIEIYANANKYNFFDQNNVQGVQMTKTLFNWPGDSIHAGSGSITSSMYADRVGFALTTPVGTVGGTGSRFSGRGSSLAGLPQVPDQLTRAAPLPPLYYTMAVDYGSHGTAANVTNKAYWISTNGMQAAGYKWITSYGWNQTNRFNGHMIINDTEFTQITNSVTITNPVGVATAIAWTTSPNPYHSGSLITVKGASPAYLNGTFSVTVTNSSSFYYAISSSAAVNTSGTANDNGIQRVCDFCHSLGFKFGIYTSYSADGETNVAGAPAGTTQCIDPGCNFTAATPPNSIYTDINDFQSWGVDMVEVDACNVSYTYEQEYELKRQFAEAVLTARVLGQNGVYLNTNQMFLWATVFKNGEDTDEIDCFNNMEDGSDYIQSTSSNVVYSATKRWTLDNARIRPGHYGEIGWVNLDSGVGSDFATFQQSVPTAMTEYSMNVMLAAPVGTGTNTYPHLFLFTNQWVNALHQDPAVIPGSMTASNSNVEVWARPMGARNSGTNAVCVVNWNTYTTNFSVFDTNCGLPPNSRFTVKDAWAQTNMGTFVNSFPVNATNGDTRLLIVSQVAQVLPVFSPANVPGLTLWWDGDQATNKVNGTSVKIVPDLSSNAYHGINLGGNCYWTSNPSMLNGRGWLQSDQAVATARFNTNFGILAPTNDMFFVGNVGGTVVNHYLMDGATNNSGEQVLFLTGNVLDLAAPSNVGTSAGISPNEMAVYEFRYTGGVGSFISVNGVQIATGNAGANSQLGINFGSAFDGTLTMIFGMAQFLEYNRDLSTGERTYIINGLMRQFNLPGATLVFTNWLPGALYTNISGGDWIVAATVSKELAASIGIAEIDLQVDETQSGTLNTRAASRETAITGGVVHTNASQVSAIVPNGGRFTFTNADSVSVSRIVAGTGFYRQIK